MSLSRRSLITGLISFAATAPAIVRAGSLMPVRQMLPMGGVIPLVSFDGEDVTFHATGWQKGNTCAYFWSPGTGFKSGDNFTLLGKTFEVHCVETGLNNAGDTWQRVEGNSNDVQD